MKKNSLLKLVFCLIISSLSYGNVIEEKAEKVVNKDKEELVRKIGNSIAIGENTNITGVQSVAIGLNAAANFNSGVVIGYNSKIQSINSVAIGSESSAGIKNEKVVDKYDRNNVSIGYKTQTGRGYSTAIGSRTRALGSYSTAVGSEVDIQEGGKRSVAIGARATIGERYVLTDPEGEYDSKEEFVRKLEKDEEKDQYGAIAIGRYSHVATSNGVAMGHMAEVKKKNSIAIGLLSEANKAEESVALGSYSVADREKGVMGYDPEGKERKSSVDKEIEKLKKDREEAIVKLKSENTEEEINENKDLLYDYYSISDIDKNIEKLEEKKNTELKNLKATRGAVSVGNKEKNITRQITNVAAGTEDTDAVNVAQLKSSVNMINEVRNGEAGIIVYTDKDGKRVVKKGDNYYTVDAINEDGILTEDSAKKIVESNDVVISLVKNGYTNNRAVLRNIADGVNDYDAVNVKQLNSLATTPVYFYSKNYNDDGKDYFTMDLDKLKFSFDEGLKVEKDGEKVKIGLDQNYIKNNPLFKGEKGEQGIQGPRGFAGTPGLPGIKGDKGDKGETGAAGKDGKDGVNGRTPEITINEKGNWVVDGKDTNQKAQGEKGEQGIQGEKGEQGIQGESGVKQELLSYNSNKKINCNEEHHKKILSSTSSNSSKDKKVGLSEGLNFVNGKNTMASTGEHGVVVYDVNKNLKDINSVENNKELEVKGGETQLTLDDNGVKVNNKKVTGIADGEIDKDSKDAVNGGQLYSKTEELNDKIEKVANDSVGKTEAINQRVESNAQRIASVEDEQRRLRKDLDNGLAQVAAMTVVDFGHVKHEKVKIGAGIGGHGSAKAVAVGVAYSPTERLLVNAKVATSVTTTRKVTYGVGATYEFE